MNSYSEAPILSPSLALPEGHRRLSACPSTQSRFQLYKEFVHVNVGKDAQDFGIHKGLLCEASSYFKAAFAGDFQEARENLVHLREDDAGSFQRFQLWLYTGTIFDVGESIDSLSQKFLIELYVWADLRGIPKLQDSLMDILQISLESTFKDDGKPLDPALIELVYSSTLQSSPLRTLWAHYYSLLGISTSPSLFKEDKTLGDLPRDFLLDIISVLLKKAGETKTKSKAGRGYEYLPSCRLHAHGQGVLCTASPWL
ncbi:hypothetical protein MMC13_003974 [Lambiella insularis]|nr:hypothetical protein [Lambiella insularis]